MQDEELRPQETGRAQGSAREMQVLAASRICIEGIDPEIDGGRFAAKCVARRPFTVRADIFGEGHDSIRAALLWWRQGSDEIHEVPMEFLVNDRWEGRFTPPENALYRYTLIGWKDDFLGWRKDTAKKIAAGLNVDVEAEMGHRLVANSRDHAPEGEGRAALESLVHATNHGSTEERLDILMNEETLALMTRAGRRYGLTRYERDLAVFADREIAAFSAWYEMFPRSAAPGTRHGTFRDVIERLPYVQDLGFDVLYFTPIHPIGRTNRKGRNNTLTPEAGDVGSPYAIGSEEGGHTAIHPELGTIEDFDALVAEARGHGLEIALDIALNASPDHPWIKEHPDWFEWRPDGSIAYAENPPKKYEDIVNFRYYLEDGSPNAPYWEAVRDMFLYWADHGVLNFRVDNPHTKPFPFWEWIIDEVRARHPGAVFLSEAFTRPKMMKRLAKLGYNQSYSYFTWRNTKAELTEYLTELTQEECRHYMRPNFFVNTPDINPYFLQSSGRAGHRIRLALAATLGGNYGVYNGYEICEAAPIPGKEEYLDSEKYEIRDWDFDREGHIKDDIRLLNGIRRKHAAMRDFTNLEFFDAHDDAVLCYGRFDRASDSYLLFHVLLDPHAGRDFAFDLPLWRFDLPDEASIEVQDAIHGNHFTWHGKEHHLTLDPENRPYAIWRLIPPGGARD
ncbi:alpha-1,4-glucan--maltose-1-phosphate maltosyltransferase [Limimaricola cinnabarinus]|uniref:Alpha-1,4-glucan:maltose-1-phosphate maltosyltransferase n=2 Tax=Limimaricola cinnabarinus TaxID=1125964 RepID=A0A2G1MCY9_9RHOB|nr:alpha-1,4-glucan--maltose-1-phosphate maltosyltransferase [Limimaricola cinnabarinus]